MAYICHGQFLLRLFQSHKVIRKKYFAKAHEACRKDVERAFGVLQSRFAIVPGPARMWDEDTLHDIIMACIIMNNMIIENE
jgi:glutathione S-transferase